MLDQVGRYEEYRDSGVDWIGDVPSDWGVKRLKFLFSETNARTRTGQETLYSLRMNEGLVPHDEVSDKPIAPEDLVDYKLIAPGQVVMNRMRAAIGIFGVAPASGLVSPDYAIFDVVPDVDAHFFLRVFKTNLMGTRFRLASKGLGTGSQGFMRLYTEEFGDIKVAVPPLKVQREIVQAIDEKTAEIDEAIGKKRRLIELLSEQKAILINRAVTRGLDPSVPLKDTGVDWIGEIPAHWGLLRNQLFLRQRKEVVGKRFNDYTLLSLTLGGVIERDMENPEGKFPAEFDTYQVVRPGDFVFCHFDVEETPRTVGLSRLHGMITGAYTVYECLRPEYARFIERLYVSLDRGKQLRPLYTGLRNTIDKTVFSHTKMPVPPSEEIGPILEWIEVATDEVETVISATSREIDALNEFKQTLIANAVTGKIKI